MLGASLDSASHAKVNPEENMGLSTLPYDLLLNIAAYLDLRDIHALHLTCKSLYDFSTTRPVYRKLANDLLRRCRALPLKGFQRLTDLTTDQLIRSVNKATRYEVAWRYRAPRPITTGHYTGINLHSNYMDMAEGQTVSSDDRKWYKVVSAPPHEDVDWLSPITSSYTLCATKSGKVVCWDVQTDTCLAVWSPGERWELWKCRVEFEQRTVFFTMAKVVSGSYDDGRIMEFVLMRLRFPENLSRPDAHVTPIFSKVTDFKTTGVVMNVFLLDPSARLLSAFVWVSTTNTIGLYALLDWNKSEYVFIDTGIECVMSSNWSCILYERNIVIHCEESDAAYQYFYPLSFLQTHARPLDSPGAIPELSGRVVPLNTLSKKFIFPVLQNNGSLLLADAADAVDTPVSNVTSADTTAAVNGTDAASTSSGSDASTSTASTSTAATSTAATTTTTTTTTVEPINPNPFPFPPWYPESAHFVRQWWPSLPGVPRVSCTVVLLASHDQETHRTRFVLAQHYFRVPLSHADWIHGTAGGEAGRVRRRRDGSGFLDGHHGIGGGGERCVDGEGDGYDKVDDALMHLWYVSTPFEVVCVMDGLEEDDDGVMERPRPLVAVDFGHAVWIEYEESEGEEEEQDAKALRFVTFPPFSDDDRFEGKMRTMEGHVKTLKIPDELKLDYVETINIDQSQGAVILSVKEKDAEGRIFILCYE